MFLAAVAAASAQTVPGLDGHWEGTLDAGAMKLRLALHVGRAPDGGLTGTMDSLDQGAKGIPVTSVKRQKSTLIIELKQISGTYNGTTHSAALTVAPPVTSDTVAITLAQYRPSTKKLSVQATSTSATATLKVYVTATGQLIGTLTNNGGKYSGHFAWPSNPQNITVRSSLGGSASRTVTLK